MNVQEAIKAKTVGVRFPLILSGLPVVSMKDVYLTDGEVVDVLGDAEDGDVFVQRHRDGKTQIVSAASLAAL